ncbi:MAG TPA: hypothetical protein VFY23_14820 [Candidatus Limnocylindrales bacterium]|nr:hypothetical protein [Candidatus Limnocylindrales bacterium]
MTRFARLTWQVPDPASFAPALAARLGLSAQPGGLAANAWVLDLGSALLEVRPWIREGPADDPAPGGRLMLEPVPGGEEPPGGEGAVADRAAMRLVGIGWATVELDRADDELGPWLGETRASAADADPHLGALLRLRDAGGLPGDAVVLAEPGTEGRLAASLARDGEGPCALWLRPAGGLTAWAAAARARGLHLASRRTGPFGTQVLITGGPVAGPHLLVIDTPRASNPRRSAGTIGP